MIDDRRHDRIKTGGGFVAEKQPDRGATARAKPTRLRIPPLSSAGLRFSKPCKPNQFQLHLDNQVDDLGIDVAIFNERRLFSPTVSDCSNAPNWKFMPKRRRSSSSSRSDMFVVSLPKTLIEPLVGLRAPMIWRSTVCRNRSFP